MDGSNFTQNFLAGNPSKTPMFSSMRSNFELDKDDKIKVDPITGQKIKKKDRRSWTRFLENPYGITAANALNAVQVPQFNSVAQGASGANLAALLGQVGGL